MIRDATHEDLDAIVDLAQALVEESPAFELNTFYRDKTRDFLAGLIESPCGILLVSNDLSGAMAGGVSEHPFSYTLFSFDYGLFVLSRRRGSFTAAALVRAFERKAKSLGAADFRPGIMTAVHVSRTTEFYERLGYAQTGTQLLKIL
jgi:GNAT superfamily N-acetyltransferase